MTPEQVRGDCNTFAAGASRLAGVVPRLLGWRPADVWEATPAELAAIFAADDSATRPAPLSRDELETLLESERHG